MNEKIPSDIKCVIFDWDGTLMDSLPLLRKVYYSFLIKFGKTGQDREFEYDLNGLYIPEIINYLKGKYSLQDSVNELIKVYEKLIKEEIEKSSPFSDSEHALSTIFKKGIKIGLATSSKKEYIWDKIKKLGWDSYFDFYVFGDDVRSSKPSPDIYLLALEKGKISKSEAVVIEDSINGIFSAKQAGIYCIGISRNSDSSQIKNIGADKIIFYLSEIEGLIETIKKYRIVSGGDINVFWKERTYFPNPEKVILINNVWEEALKTKKLFNGSIFIFSDLQKEDTTKVSGFFAEYKEFFACRKKPGLNLNLSPIAVSGIIIINDLGKRYAVFGKRKGTIQYPESLELIPSGGLEREFALENGEMNYKGQLIKEFEEETCLDRKHISSVTTLGLVHDEKEDTYDICSQIDCALDRETFKISFKNSEEYNELFFIEIGNLKEFVEKNRANLVPTSEALIELYLEKSSWQKKIII